MEYFKEEEKEWRKGGCKIVVRGPRRGGVFERDMKGADQRGDRHETQGKHRRSILKRKEGSGAECGRSKNIPGPGKGEVEDGS